MSNELISTINIECLMNREQYKQYTANKDVTNKGQNIYRKDLKFYRRRIYDLTKQLISSNPEESIVQLPIDIKQAFQEYTQTCIHYFKILDKTDILQEDYTNINMDENIVKVDDNNTNLEDMNQNLLRSIKLREPNSLEKLVKRTVTKNPNSPQIPQQKDINLKDPILKNKGICKKKNITNKYDEKILESTKNIKEKKEDKI